MPANTKYLTPSKAQRFAKITAGILGGYLVAQSLHLLIALYTDRAVVLITAAFSMFLLWAALLILAFLAKNGWKIWLLYLGITLVLTLAIVLSQPAVTQGI